MTSEYVKQGTFRWVIGGLCCFFLSLIIGLFNSNQKLDTEFGVYKSDMYAKVTTIEVKVGGIETDVSWIKKTLEDNLE